MELCSLICWTGIQSESVVAINCIYLMEVILIYLFNSENGTARFESLDEQGVDGIFKLFRCTGSMQHYLNHYFCFSQIFDDAYKSPLSCVIVDDIERLLGERFYLSPLEFIWVLPIWWSSSPQVYSLWRIVQDLKWILLAQSQPQIQEW